MTTIVPIRYRFEGVFCRVSAVLSLCLVVLWTATARSEEADPEGADRESNPVSDVELSSFEDFVAAVRAGRPAKMTVAPEANTTSTTISNWTGYGLAKLPDGCETESGIRKQLGKPESVREMAGWKMLDYPEAGYLFIVSPLGNATAAAYVKDADEVEDASLAADDDALALVSPTEMIGRFAGYVGGWTGLSFERMVEPTAGDNGKAQAREIGATRRDESSARTQYLFTPKEYDVRDRTLRLIRAAM